MEEFKEKDLPPKAIAIFEGFIKLRDEGSNLLEIKVSDIAKAAGIGKGTVYEYFGSKEEIIVKAMVYEAFLALNSLQEILEKADGFMDMLNQSLDWMSDNVRKAGIVLQGLKKEDKYFRSKEEFCHDFLGEGTFERIEKAANQILKAGSEEGIIRLPENRLERDMILTASAAAFMTYLSHPDNYNEYSYEDAKRMAKQILLHALRKK